MTFPEIELVNMDVANEVNVIPRECGDGYGSFHGPALTDTWCRGEISTAMLKGSTTGDPLTVGTVGLGHDHWGMFGNASYDQVCPVVPEIYDLKRCEALGSDGYDYYEGFDSRSRSYDYDDPRDYQEWDEDIEDTEGYYDIFPGEGEGDSVTASCASAVYEVVITAEGSSRSWVAPKGYDGPEFICDPCVGEVLHRPRIPSELDTSVQEQGDTMCLLDYSVDIDPGPGVCYPRTRRGRIHAVFIDLYGPDLWGGGGGLWEAGVLPTVSDFVVTSGLGSKKLHPGSAGILSTLDQHIGR